MMYSFAFFGVIFAIANHWVSSAYEELDTKKCRQAALHIITGSFATIVAPAAILMLLMPDEAVQSDPIYGYSPVAQLAFGFTTGFFCLELFIIALFFDDLYDFASVAHGVAVLLVYLLAQFPFLPYMGAICLLFELSTPFLKTFRFLEMVNPTSILISPARTCFAVAFIVSRIVIGVPYSIWWWGDMIKLLGTSLVHSRAVVYFYMVCNIGLNALNLMWLLMILKGIFKKKSEEPKKGPLLPTEDAEEVGLIRIPEDRLREQAGEDVVQNQRLEHMSEDIVL